MSFAFALGRAVKFRRPFDEGPFSVRHRRQTQRRDIVLDAHRRFKDRVGAEHIVVGEAKELLADSVAIAQTEVAHAADLVGGLPALDAAFGDRRVPVRHAIEVAYASPDPVAAAVDHAGNKNARHERPQLLFRGDEPPLGGGAASDSFFAGAVSLRMPCMSRASRMSPGILARLPPSTPISDKSELIRGACTR